MQPVFGPPCWVGSFALFSKFKLFICTLLVRCGSLGFNKSDLIAHKLLTATGDLEGVSGSVVFLLSSSCILSNSVVDLFYSAGVGIKDGA